MAIIECKECKHNISTKASSCPNCGAPVSKTKQIIKDDYEEITIKKEVTHPLTAIIYILFFIVLIVVCLYDINLIKTFRNTYSLIAAQSENAFKVTASLYSSVIINSTFIACILTSISKKTFKVSKIAFIINLIAHIYFFYFIYNHNFRVEIQYFILFILNIIFLILPRFNKLEETTKIVKKDKLEYLTERSTKLEEYYKKPNYNTFNKLILILLFITSIINLLIIYNINKEPIYHETTIQEKTDYQIEIINDYINVRSKPSTSAAKLGEVSQSDIYNVLDVMGGDNYIWYKIEYKDTIGYISSSRTEPYVKELYSDELIVNIICDTSSKCNKLHHQLITYKEINNTFLIKFINIEEDNNKEIINTLNTYFEEEATIPYITVGTERIHTEDIYDRTISNIKNPIDKEYNLVDIIKKGDNLPLLKQPLDDNVGSNKE